MRYPTATAFLAVVLLATLSSPLRADDDDSHTTPQQQAIAAVVALKMNAGQECQRIEIEGKNIAYVRIHGWRYLEMIRKIDVSACPSAFRTAWSDYCAAWSNKIQSEKANRNTVDLISTLKGCIYNLQETSRRLEAYDTDPAWQHCEQVATDAGVPACDLQ
jgi:hypothetical protein